MLSTIHSNSSNGVLGANAIKVFCGADNPVAFSTNPIAARMTTAAIQKIAAAATSSAIGWNPRRNPNSSDIPTRFSRSPHHVNSSNAHSEPIPNAYR